jgi:methoxymalonate biosynthesis acyl carrier protein
MTSTDSSTVIRVFLRERISESFGDHEDIFALGVVNSLFAIELVMFVEKTFQIQVPNEELTLDNFRTVHSMAELVGRQLASTSSRS